VEWCWEQVKQQIVADIVDDGDDHVEWCWEQVKQQRTQTAHIESEIQLLKSADDNLRGELEVAPSP
jgi:hypothetical protein